MPDLPPALRYIAQDALTGYGEAADRLVRALRLSGARVEYRGWSTPRDEGPTGLRPHSRDAFPTEDAPPGAPVVVHLVPEHYPSARTAVGNGAFVAHTVWETDRLPRHWPALLNDVDRVVVPTAWNREVFAASGVTAPMAVVPHVACEAVPGDAGAPLDLPEDAVVFYTISRWDQRKDPATVVRAFLEAFTADDAVVLVVKTTPITQYPLGGRWGRRSPLAGTTMLEVARIVREFPNPPLVQVEVDDWTPARVAGLHTRGDCFVSLSHGEAWGLGAFDATAYGNPVVMTGWGGHLEYLDPDESFLVEYDLAPVEHFEPESYSPDQRWALPRVDHAVELMHEVYADLGAARRRAAPARPRVLDDYKGARVVRTAREHVPELDLPRVPSVSGRQPAIPRIVHFVFGLKSEPESLHLVHYLAIRSCLDVVRPDEVYLHCHHVPSGTYWDRLADRITVRAVEPVPAVAGFEYRDPVVSRYRYAHHADFIRLDVLADHGGIYADIDTLFVAPVPDDLWSEPFVIGREADVPDPMTGVLRPALSNAVLMAAPGSRFAEEWRAATPRALDGTWSAHSCFLAYDLARRMPRHVHVEAQRTFHAFDPSPAGIAGLLAWRVPDLTGVVALHLAAHLWWDEDRRDFSDVHAGVIDEEWIRNTNATYPLAARRFLPE